MCRAVAVTFRDSLCDTFNVSNEYKITRGPWEESVCPRHVTRQHLARLHHLVMGRLLGRSQQTRTQQTRTQQTLKHNKPHDIVLCPHKTNPMIVIDKVFIQKNKYDNS